MDTQRVSLTPAVDVSDQNPPTLTPGTLSALFGAMLKKAGSDKSQNAFLRPRHGAARTDPVSHAVRVLEPKLPPGLKTEINNWNKKREEQVRQQALLEELTQASDSDPAFLDARAALAELRKASRGAYLPCLPLADWSREHLGSGYSEFKRPVLTEFGAAVERLPQASGPYAEELSRGPNDPFAPESSGHRVAYLEARELRACSMAQARGEVERFLAGESAADNRVVVWREGQLHPPADRR